MDDLRTDGRSKERLVNFSCFMNHAIFDQPVHLIRNGRQTDFSSFAIDQNLSKPIYPVTRLLYFRQTG